jgi:hypothetical protein
MLDIDFVGRNSREPRRSNHGSRPNSSVMRKLKKRAFYRKPKEKVHNDPESLKKPDF